MSGARLAYVVVALDGEVERPRMSYDKEKGLTETMVKEPAGFLVYFPKGHVIRIRSEKELKSYGLDLKPAIINMEGLQDPNSPLGKLFFEQDEGDRADSWALLEQQVIDLATRAGGKQVMPEMIMQKNDVNTDIVRPASKAFKPKSTRRVKENA